MNDTSCLLAMATGGAFVFELMFLDWAKNEGETPHSKVSRVAKLLFTNWAFLAATAATFLTGIAVTSTLVYYLPSTIVQRSTIALFGGGMAGVVTIRIHDRLFTWAKLI